METAPQSGKQSKGVSVIGALAGMLITFFAGIFVGLHPAWIPIKGSGNSGVEVPMHAPDAVNAPDHMVMPATQSATKPS